MNILAVKKKSNTANKDYYLEKTSCEIDREIRNVKEEIIKKDSKPIVNEDVSLIIEKFGKFKEK